MYNVFHVSQPRKYVQDPSHVIEPDPIQLQEDLSYEEQLVRIIDRREKQLRRKTLGKSEVSEATWELEPKMRAIYPHLFL